VFRNEIEAPKDFLVNVILHGCITYMVHEKNKSGYSLQRKFFIRRREVLAICKAQGGFREPELLYKEDIKAEKSGIVTEIDNRRLAKLQMVCTTIK
jgi:thymidine phosphorylase